MEKNFVLMSVVLAAIQVASLSFAVALEGFAKPNDGVIYIVFPPWSTTADDKRRIIQAGGQPLADPVWRFIFKVAVKKGMVARIAVDGAILAFAADRRPICSSPVARA